MNKHLVLDKIKNIISLKQILQIRIFCSSIFEKISFGFIEDFPITTLNRFNNNYTQNIDNLFTINNSLIIIGLLTICYTIYNLDNKNNSIKKIDNLINYYKIRRSVNQLFIIFSIIFFKNVISVN